MYSVHTSNRGWLEPPNPFRHIRPAVTVQYDPSVADDSYRLYYGDTPLDKPRKMYAAQLRNVWNQAMDKIIGLALLPVAVKVGGLGLAVGAIFGFLIGVIVG